MPWISVVEWEEPEWTLGWMLADWVETYLRVPGGADYGRPLVLSGWQLRALADWYALDASGQWLFRRGQIRLAKGTGKALALDTPIPTPDGWATMGELNVGDVVFDADGARCSVIAATPTMLGHDCYEVRFNDGQVLTCDADHLWVVEDIRTKYVSEVASTRSMVERGVVRPDGAKYFRVKNAGPLDLADATLPMDPYVLGVWLGDGELHAGRFTSNDIEIVDEVAASGYRVTSQRGSYRWGVPGLLADLRAAGVLDRKHVPAVYLRASAAQRLALLQGLMDTDGYVGGETVNHRRAGGSGPIHYRQGGTCEFCSTDAALADGVFELAASLGLKPSVKESRATLNGRDCGPRWRVTFRGYVDVPVFRLPRKAARLCDPSRFTERAGRGTRGPSAGFRHIASITAVPTAPVRCITVSSPSGTFLAGRAMIPTHNSPFAAAVTVAELCGPSQFDGWDARGEPVGRPHRAPEIQIAACSEVQAGNTYHAMRGLLDGSPLVDELGVDVGITRTLLRGRPGRVDMVTASAGSREGQPISFAVCDETHLWTRSNGGQKLYATLRRNAAKMGARLLATTNAYDPGAESVAERIEHAALQQPGTMVYGPQYEAAVEDLSDVGQVRAGLAVAYRDAPWVDQRRIVQETQDPDMAAEDVHRFFFNVNRAAASVLCASPQDGVEPLEEGAPLAVGFDGSRRRDATALVGVHMTTGVAYLLGYWERPFGLPKSERWEVPERHDGVSPGVLDVFDQLFSRFRVARMKADRAWWQEAIADLQNRHGKQVVDRMPVDQASVVDQAIRATQTALEGGHVRVAAGADHDVLRAQVQRCVIPRRMVGSRELRMIVKASEGAGDRNDAACALIYAVQARHEALANGWADKRAPVPVLVWGDDD